MRYVTTRFGDISIADEQVICFAEGIAPFAAQRYTLLTREGEEPFAWLQCLDEPGLAFIVTPIEVVSDDAEPFGDWAGRGSLGLDATESPLALCLVTLGESAESSTVNLLAPLVINPHTGLGRQVILGGEMGLLRAPLFREEPMGRDQVRMSGQA
jgi:flagellar assembly factor FliW